MQPTTVFREINAEYVFESDPRTETIFILTLVKPTFYSFTFLYEFRLSPSLGLAWPVYHITLYVPYRYGHYGTLNYIHSSLYRVSLVLVHARIQKYGRLYH